MEFRLEPKLEGQKAMEHRSCLRSVGVLQEVCVPPVPESGISMLIVALRVFSKWYRNEIDNWLTA